MDTRAYASDVAECAPERPLESIANAVNRINTAQVQISRFLDRFHGPQAPAGDPPSKDGIEPTLPHSQNINRLFAAIDRLESRVESLGQIG